MIPMSVTHKYVYFDSFTGAFLLFNEIIAQLSKTASHVENNYCITNLYFNTGGIST